MEAVNGGEDGVNRKGERKSRSNTSMWQDLQGDYGSVALLLLLYTLQGIPMGLAASIPLLLQERGATYAQQSIFSFVSWPFSLVSHPSEPSSCALGNATKLTSQWLLLST